MQILVTGASGQLGTQLLRNLAERGHPVIAWSGTTEGEHCGFPLERVELSDPVALRAAIEKASPDVVIHAGARSGALLVRRDPEASWAVNVRATEVLSEWAGKNERRLLFTSTDLVFDGTKSWYRENDVPTAILEYGRTKVAAEAMVLKNCRGLVVRLSLLYGMSDPARALVLRQGDRRA